MFFLEQRELVFFCFIVIEAMLMDELVILLVNDGQGLARRARPAPHVTERQLRVDVDGQSTLEAGVARVHFSNVHP